MAEVIAQLGEAREQICSILVPAADDGRPGSSVYEVNSWMQIARLITDSEAWMLSLSVEDSRAKWEAALADRSTRLGNPAIRQPKCDSEAKGQCVL
jgi:hypothetical protein